MSQHDPYAALRHPGYRCLLGGGVIASLGLEIQAVAVAWELYDRTDSAWYLALAGLAQFLPVLLFALPAGQIADHLSRKRLFQLAQLGSAFISLTLAWLSWSQGPVHVILLCLFLSGTTRAFSAPARTALLPQVVPGEALTNAVTWNSTGWQVANISGPALGGFLLAAAPPWLAYLVTASCSLVCVLLLTPIVPLIEQRVNTTRSLAALLAGVRFVLNNPLLLGAISLDLFAVLLGGATALLPIYARDILQVGPTGLGWLRAAPALGAVIMALTMAHRPPLQRPGLAMLLAVAGFGLATVVFGLSTSFPLSLAMLGLLGALDNISVVVRGTLMQVLTPDEMRGRVAAVNTVFISSSNELGQFESGVTAAWWGPVTAVVVGGVGTMVVVGVVLTACPRLLKLSPLHLLRRTEVADEIPPGTTSKNPAQVV
ncbi:MAG: MFS transporter [Gemmataceae bacterium]